MKQINVKDKTYGASSLEYNFREQREMWLPGFRKQMYSRDDVVSRSDAKDLHQSGKSQHKTEDLRPGNQVKHESTSKSKSNAKGSNDIPVRLTVAKNNILPDIFQQSTHKLKK